MKRFAISLLLVFACRGGENVTSTDTISTSGTQTTGTTSTTSTGASGGGISSLKTKDKEFFIAAAQGNMSEVALGKLASDKATDAGVKAFGNRMVTDHGKGIEELKKLALQKGVALPAVVNKEESEAADTLSKKVGKDFDHAYMTDMIKDHEKDVSEFKQASLNLTDPDMRAWATKTLPVLQDHLRMAKTTESKLK